MSFIKGDMLINSDFDHPPKSPTSQQGAGDYTLCHKCNNNTGAWYGAAFVAFAYQAMAILKYTKGRPSKKKFIGLRLSLQIVYVGQ